MQVCSSFFFAVMLISSSVRQPAILGAIIIDHPSHPGNMIQDQSSSFANPRVLVVPQWLRWCPVESAGELCLGLPFFRSGMSRM